jgi:hypothetical protein
MTDEPVTKPTIETVLERLAEFRESVNGQLESLQGQLATFQDSVELQLHKLDRKIGALNDDILTLRADMRLLEKTVETITEKS